jgi:hypothetical protein
MSSLRRYAFLILGLELAWLMGIFGCGPNGCGTGQVNPQGYNCTSNSCTAVVDIWSGVPTMPGSFPPSILGYQTSILVPANTSDISGGDGSITNSMKMIANASNAFVEVGYIVQGVINLGQCGQPGMYYFWTDAASGAIVMHCLSAVPSGDLDHYANVRIANVANTGATPTFSVSITNQTTNLTPCTSATPCSEPLWTPGSQLLATAQLGMTLLGSHGASANSMLFFQNAYQSTAGNFPLQASDGGVSFSNPPLGGWTEWPSQPNQTDGGDFFTFCCVVPTVFPDALYFGTVAVATVSQAQTTTVTNTSSTSGLNIANFTITGTNAGDFKIASTGTTCTPGQSLPSLGTCTISVTFTPSLHGAEGATLTVTDSGGSGSGTDVATLLGYGQ